MKKINSAKNAEKHANHLELMCISAICNISKARMNSWYKFGYLLAQFYYYFLKKINLHTNKLTYMNSYVQQLHKCFYV